MDVSPLPMSKISKHTYGIHKNVSAPLSQDILSHVNSSTSPVYGLNPLSTIITVTSVIQRITGRSLIRTHLCVLSSLMNVSGQTSNSFAREIQNSSPHMPSVSQHATAVTMHHEMHSTDFDVHAKPPSSVVASDSMISKISPSCNVVAMSDLRLAGIL